MVWSNCAESERPQVTAFQPSDSPLMCGLPSLIIGSMHLVSFRILLIIGMLVEWRANQLERSSGIQGGTFPALVTTSDSGH